MRGAGCCETEAFCFSCWKVKDFPVLNCRRCMFSICGDCEGEWVTRCSLSYKEIAKILARNMREDKVTRIRKGSSGDACYCYRSSSSIGYAQLSHRAVRCHLPTALLRSGAHGCVYRGWDSDTMKPVAIKGASRAAWFLTRRPDIVLQ